MAELATMVVTGIATAEQLPKRAHHANCQLLQYYSFLVVTEISSNGSDLENQSQKEMLKSDQNHASNYYA